MMTKTCRLHLSIFVVIGSLFGPIHGLSPRDSGYFSKREYKTYNNVPVRLVVDEASQARYDLASDPAKTHSPVVFWHGMGDTAYGSVNIERLALQRKYPNITVLSIQIGDNVMEDELSSYFGNVNYQVESACHLILNNSIIKAHGSFNAIGFSQGGQFLRGLIQRCPLKENGIKVKNFVSIGGQHQGVFGLPRCGNKLFCDHIRSLLTNFVYDDDIQHSLIQAAYWHDPKREEVYREKSGFIADINNENYIIETYRNNLLNLDNLVLIEFLRDHMVVPRESSLFGYYEPGQTGKLITLEESKLYREDRLGLKTLNEQGRLHKISLPGDHLQYTMSWFMNNIASIYLDN